MTKLFFPTMGEKRKVSENFLMMQLSEKLSIVMVGVDVLVARRVPREPFLNSYLHLSSPDCLLSRRTKQKMRKLCMNVITALLLSMPISVVSGKGLGSKEDEKKKFYPFLKEDSRGSFGERVSMQIRIFSRFFFSASTLGWLWSFCLLRCFFEKDH